MAVSPVLDRPFTQIKRALTVLALASTLGGCAKSFDPFQVPRDDIRGRITTIAMAPANVSQQMMSLIDTRATFEPIATQRLEAAGFRVLPSETWQDLWLQAATDVGEIYDPSTGAVNEERFKLVREAVYRALENEHQAHAVLYLTVQLEDLYNTGSQVYFCGGRGQVHFPSYHSGKPDPLLYVMLARAACLTASLYDMESRFLYGIRDALEVIETYANQTRAIRPKGERLKDPQKIERALETVVGPLADGAGPSTHP